MTGGILAVSRAGEVAPILFTASLITWPRSRQAHGPVHGPGLPRFRPVHQSHQYREDPPILYATVLVLLMLTFALNFVAVLIRAACGKNCGLWVMRLTCHD